MRIYIREPKKFGIYLVLPTRLALNRLSARLLWKALHASGKMEGWLPGEEDLNRLFREVLRIKRKYRGMELVDVRCVDGTVVKLRL